MVLAQYANTAQSLTQEVNVALIYELFWGWYTDINSSANLWADILTEKILIVGYSNSLKGGVVNVTRTFMNNYRGVELYPVLHCYRPRWKALIVYLWRLTFFPFKMFIGGRPAIVIVIVGSSGDAIRSFPIIALARLCSVPVCCQYHKSSDHVIPPIKNQLVRKIVLWGLNKSGWHWFLSKRLKEGYFKYLTPTTNTVVIPNAIDDAWIDIEPISLGKRSVDIVFFGRWSWEKGVDDLLSVMENIGGEHHCNIYASNAPNKKFKNCSVHNWVSQESVREIMKSARLLLLPSYSEAYPTVLLEALACGTPFVASDVGGIKDIAEESMGGVSFPVGDKEALKKAVLYIKESPDEWTKLSKSGKEWSKSVALSNVSRLWDDFFRDVT